MKGYREEIAEAYLKETGACGAPIPPFPESLADKFQNAKYFLALFLRIEAMGIGVRPLGFYLKLRLTLVYTKLTNKVLFTLCFSIKKQQKKKIVKKDENDK